MDFNKSKTKQNLARLFAGECQDGARYQFIAKTAKAQGYKYISDILKMLAKNEMAHASVIYNFIEQNSGKEVKNIEIHAGYPFEGCNLENGLLASSGAELSQAENIYPHFAKIAKDEGFDEIAKLFENIMNVEIMHKEIFEELYKPFTGRRCVR